MSGNYYEMKSMGFTSEVWDQEKNGSRRAALAGHGQETARLVHSAALEYSAKTGKTYDEVEQLIVNYMWNDTDSRAAYNAALDKYSQPMKPGPNLDQTGHDVYKIMKGKLINKSSKGKHPSNYTPPKKKRK